MINLITGGIYLMSLLEPSWRQIDIAGSQNAGFACLENHGSDRQFLLSADNDPLKEASAHLAAFQIDLLFPPQ